MAALLRLFRLGHQSLWVDEAFSTRSAGVGGDWSPARLLEDVHGPLYTLLLHVGSRLAGESEWALRLPSALLGIALVAAIAWLAGRWIGPAARAPAAWLAAGSPFLVWYAQEARNYTLLMLCACLASLALLRLSRGGGARAATAYLGAAWAGVLSNFAFVLIAPLHLRWWLAGPGRRLRRLAAAGGAAAVLLILTSPWLSQVRAIWDWRRLEPQRVAEATEPPLRGGGTTFHAAALPFAASSFAVGYTLGPPLRTLRGRPGWETLRPHAVPLAASAIVFGALTGLGLRALRRRGRLGEGLLWLLVPALIVSYFAIQNFKVFHPRYLAVSVPGFVALLAAAFVDLGSRGRAVFGAAVALLWALSLRNHYFDPRYGKEDMRGAAALLAARGSAGERIVAANTENPLFHYYRGPLPVVSYWLGWAADPEHRALRLEALLADTPGAWVVLSRPEDLDPDGAFERHLDQRYPEAERFRFEGVRVWHLERPAGPGPPGAAPGGERDPARGATARP